MHSSHQRQYFAALAGLVLGVAAWAGTSAAQDAAPQKGQPLDLLEHALGTLDAPPPAGDDSTRDEVLAQLNSLREVVTDLQRVLDEKLVAIQQLEDENEKLRQALRLRFGGGSDSGLPPVPIANRDLIESVLREAPSAPERKETLGPPSSPEAFTIVSEWGRSPEVAASLPGNVSSLIGLTIAVEKNKAGTESLQQLGAELRQNYAHYDNINIEVFDDIGAARTYADKGELDASRRVLSVSRFKHSGRDDIVIYKNGQPVPKL